MVWLEQHETHTVQPVGQMSASRAIRMARALRDGGDLQGAIDA
jgi:hypothetical protein